MACTHERQNSEYVTEVDDFYGTESSRWVYTTVSTTQDIDTGRYRCTQCGEVMYYTGQWRDFFEKGKPCAGSDRIRVSKR